MVILLDYWNIIRVTVENKITCPLSSDAHLSPLLSSDLGQRRR